MMKIVFNFAQLETMCALYKAVLLVFKNKHENIHLFAAFMRIIIGEN